MKENITTNFGYNINRNLLCLKKGVNICGMIHLNLTVDIHIHHVHRATAPDPHLLQKHTNNRT